MRPAALICLVLVPCLHCAVAETFKSESASPYRFRAGASTMSSRAAAAEDDAFTVGGGDINEKKRTFLQSVQVKDDFSGYDPVNKRSHLWNALEGLDRYPNYLSRWSEEDMDRLEASLETQLEKVRNQKKAVLDRRRGIEAMVQRLVQDKEWRSLFQPAQSWEQVRDSILDPRAVKAIFKSKQFASSSTRPTVQQVLSGQVAIELDAHLLEGLMDEELFDVYSLPLLSPEFCGPLKSFVQELSRLADTEEFAYLHLGRADMDTVGLSWINNLLFHLLVRPISRHLFRETELDGGDLDFRHGYVASYAARPNVSSPRERLVAHTDDSEVTLNICIGDEFEGGALNFRGLRGMDQAGQQLIGDFQPKLGTAILHAGRHFHEVTQVTAGHRYVYIMWARSWGAARAKACPCCWLNRRQDNSCICGPRWN